MTYETPAIAMTEQLRGELIVVDTIPKVPFSRLTDD